MRQNQRLKILKSHQWIEEEARASLLVLDITKSCYLDIFKWSKKYLFSTCVYFAIADYAFELVRSDETKNVFRWALKKWRTNKVFFKKKDKEFEQISRSIKKIFPELKKTIKGLTDRQFKDLTVLIFALWREQYGYSVVVEGADALTESDYSSFLPKTVGADFPEVVRKLAISEDLSIIEREKLSLLKIAAKIAAKKSADGELEKHTQNYFWIQNNFREAVYLDKKYFVKQIEELTKTKSLKDIQQDVEKIENKKQIVIKERNKIYKKYRLFKEAKLFFELIRYFTILQDKRKENIQRLMFCIDLILEETEKRFKVAKSDLENYFAVEMIELLEKGKKVSRADLRKREKVVFFSYVKNNKVQTDVLLGKEADEIINFSKQRRAELATSKIIKGFVASPGKGSKTIEGRVRIVFNPSKDTFQKNEILVTGMTRPEFVPLIKRAKAIITNEGGITTHAAIISRELQVPCIIGTKIATDILRNGDYIQLDLEKGTVKILK